MDWHIQHWQPSATSEFKIATIRNGTSRMTYPSSNLIPGARVSLSQKYFHDNYRSQILTSNITIVSCYSLELVIYIILLDLEHESTTTLKVQIPSWFLGFGNFVDMRPNYSTPSWRVGGTTIFKRKLLRTSTDCNGLQTPAGTTADVYNPESCI